MKQTNHVAEITISYKPAISSKPIITSALDAYTELIEFFPKQTIALQERFVCMYLNRSNRLLGVHTLSTGGITGTVADVRLILSIALKTTATGIILAHNHPSGNLKPSYQDEQITQKVKQAAELMDIKLLDHLIISPAGDYFSMMENIN